MGITEIITLILNNGIGVVSVAYLIYFQNNTLNKITEALNSLKEEISKTNTRLSVIESKIEDRK